MSSLARATETQRLAADPQSSVFVTANAGSGKTKVLVDRIARLLLDGFAPSAFLCITYTKAAAAEMQRRLFDRLGGWCVADDATLAGSLTDLRGAPPRAGELARARSLFARALETPGGLRIQTIHAFCERILARFPIEAEVAPGFEIADDARAMALRAEAWAQALVRTPDAALRFAAALDGDRLQSFIGALMRRRDLFERAPPSAEQLRARHRAPADRAAFVADLLGGIDWRAMAAICESLGDHATARRLRAMRTADDAARLDAYFDVFLTDEREPRKQLYTKKHATDFPWIVDALANEQARAERGFRALLAADRSEDAIAADALGRMLVSAYQDAKDETGALDFDDLIVRTRRLLSSGASAWVLYKLDGGIDHILIDEGQDTSPSQWDLIAPLQEEFFAGEGRRGQERTVFAVGDPKQSIYSFQGADPDRFLAEAQLLERRAAAADRAFAAPDMTMSFRSTPEILRAVDAVFAQIDVGAGPPGIFDRVRHEARRAEERGCVEWWPLTPRPETPDGRPWHAPRDMEPAATATSAMAQAIARAVKASIAEGAGVWESGALRPMRPGDVLVLVRSRGPVFRQFLKAFKQAGLPVAGADRMVMRDEIAVEDMLTLFRVILDPSDDLALATALKGPLIGLTDDDVDVFPLAHGRARGESLWDRLQAATDARYAYAQSLIGAMVARRGAAPFEVLSALLEMPDSDNRSGWTRMFERLGAEARDPLEELLARALACARDGPATLQHFLSAIEQDEQPIKREMEHGGDVVRIMTVHGSKGLEAPFVILPDTVSAPDSGPSDLLFEDPLGPIVSQSKAGDDDVARAARAAAAERAFAEHKRLMYVALTRARDRLIVCGHRSGRGEGEAPEACWHSMVGAGLRALPDVVTIDTPFGEGLRLGEPLFVASAGATVDSPFPIPRWARTAAPNEPPILRTSAPSQLGRPAARAISLDAERRFQRGRLIHGLLERLPDVAPMTRRAAGLRWLAPQGAIGPAADALIDEALAVIDHPDFASVFGPGSRAETPIVGRGAGLPTGGVRGIVDRLVVTRDEVLAVDFKTDRPAPDDVAGVAHGYLAQLAAYRAVLALAFPDRPVRCALIWTEAPRLMPIPAALLDAVLTA